MFHNNHFGSKSSDQVPHGTPKEGRNISSATAEVGGGAAEYVWLQIS